MIAFQPNTAASPTTREAIERIENVLGMKFPDSFVTLLKSQNGGVPSASKFRHGANVRVVDRILPILTDFETDPDGDYDIEVVWTQIEGRLGDGLVPFASLFGGDFLCFDTEGKVVLWSHEESGEDAPVTVPVADDFEHWAQTLRP